MNLTPEQQEAVRLGVDRIVVAGAGSGKTHVLSVRYAALFASLVAESLRAGRDLPDPDAVLVLTFTAKAAAEMAARCRARLLDIPCDDAVRSGLKRVVARFERARIETFHAFAGRVAREFPAACGVRDGVRVLEGARAERFREASVREALTAAAPDDVRRLVPALGGRDALAGAVRAAVNERGRAEAALRAGVLSDDPADARDLSAWLERVAPAVRGAAVLLAGAPAGSGASRFRAAATASPDGSVGALLACVTDGERLFDLRHPSFLGPRTAWSDARAHDRARTAMSALAAVLAEAPARWQQARRLRGPADDVLVDVLAALSRVVDDALVRLRTRLSDDNALDFAELQLRAVRAVTTDDAVRSALSARHRFVLVDEFQDTDEAQWQLVQALAPEPGRLFLVGDPKQAIYGFRGGDVTVFGEAARARGVQPVPLSTNFRARPALIDGINAWFARILGPPSPQRPRWEASFTGLLPGRTDEGGTIAVVPCDAEAGGAVAAEADAVASLVSRYLDPHGEHGASAWGDVARHPLPPVAVLFRSRAHMDEFEGAVRARGVPYVVASGQGFYARREVIDVVQVLAAIVDEEPRAVVAALRSPLFAVPDAEIYAAAGPARDAALGTLAALREGRHDVPIGTFVRDVLDRTTALHAWAVADPDGTAERNVARLVALAEAAEANSTLGEFVEDLRRAVDAGTREADVVLEAGPARVVLMTVHASKGLEFPVVIVPRLGAEVRHVDEPLVLARPGGPGTPWYAATTVLDPTAPVRTRTAPAARVRLAGQRRAEEEAESRRLLYVALTRARDALALVVTPASAAEGSWWTLLSPSLGTPSVVQADPA